MPRLLLVDDNPSIHKIAETLLATGPVELVCVDSAAAALARVERGEHFDVALLDTSMAGMDGWGLLAKLRELPATAQMPIAMMAGVLDTVDPERVKNAPIQGFLKKPVELRDLGERVLRLAETPVPPPPEPVAPEPPEPVVPTPPPPSPYATMPATRLDDLPEFRQERTKEAPAAVAPEEDVLELTEEDLYPAAEPEEPREETLDLEELDLEGLQALAPQLAAPPAEAFEATPPTPDVTPQEWAWQEASLDAVATLDRLPEVPAEEPGPSAPVPEVEFPDLGAPLEPLMDISSLGNLPAIEEAAVPDSELVTAPEMDLSGLLESPESATPFAPALAAAEEPLDWADESESMLAAVEAPGPADLVPQPDEELDVLDLPAPEEAPAPVTLLAEPAEGPELPVIESFLVPELELQAPSPVEAALAEVALEPVPAPVEAPVATSVPAPTPAPAIDAKDLLASLTGDPALMDALAKAVVARLGDQVLREIAWEVMPELAERLPRS